jgi:UDP-N-acetylglucosamine--N-acetylmuramyl-(pentapeptide) pyrophosphoryl-undecaprenol N-acetylglucosamine transferase
MGSKTEAAEHFNLNKDKKTVLVIGGSLGARTINQSIMAHMDTIGHSDIQLLWQTGKYYYKDAKAVVEKSEYKNIRVLDFIVRMDYAYSLADVIISRAGAGTISELCLVGKPVVLVPSPNVAEDHQTKNAMALVNKNAAIMVKDSTAETELVDRLLNLVHDKDKMIDLSKNIQRMALRDSAKIIAEEVLKLE